MHLHALCPSPMRFGQRKQPRASQNDAALEAARARGRQLHNVCEIPDVLEPDDIKVLTDYYDSFNAITHVEQLNANGERLHSYYGNLNIIKRPYFRVEWKRGGTHGRGEFVITKESDNNFEAGPMPPEVEDVLKKVMQKMLAHVRIKDLKRKPWQISCRMFRYKIRVGHPFSIDAKDWHGHHCERLGVFTMSNPRGYRGRYQLSPDCFYGSRTGGRKSAPKDLLYDAPPKPNQLILSRDGSAAGKTHHVYHRLVGPYVTPSRQHQKGDVVYRDMISLHFKETLDL